LDDYQTIYLYYFTKSKAEAIMQVTFIYIVNLL